MVESGAGQEGLESHQERPLFIDARTLSDAATLEADVCIVGAGAAGITLACELAGADFRVLLVESGGLDAERQPRSLSGGESVGVPYFPLEATRMGGFGGTTRVWAGWCRPLDPIDFEQRPWVPCSGWPFNKSHLDSFYARAHPYVEVGPYVYEPDAWHTPEARPLPLAEGEIVHAIFHVSPPTDFGRVHRSRIRGAPNVRTLLHANAVELRVDDSQTAVTRLVIRTLSGKGCEVAARTFVLAAGGIENARLLLLSRGTSEAGLANAHDAVGRYFMEHVFVDAGSFFPADPYVDLGFYFPRSMTPGGSPRVAARSAVRGVFAVAEAKLREERLLNAAMFFRPRYEAHDAFSSRGVTSALEIWERLRGRGLVVRPLAQLANVLTDLDQVGIALWRKAFARSGPIERLRVRAYVESPPNRESRVTLVRDTDVLGKNRVRLDWRLSGREIPSMRRALELLDGALRAGGQGRLELDLDGGPHGPRSLTGGKHHMGTTRMHRDPRLGVVDPDCRVHGVKNLFAAGSSVFPTAGYTNPTLTIVALAIRLADHLKSVIRQGPSPLT
ncbi:MAG: GMC family oxidoreductase [Gemmatimonadetes bacterium]|nr:GMC family oxidoreductase [Gemmatimonadota bacterium]